MSSLASRSSETFTPDMLIANESAQLIARKITLKSGAGALLRGTVVGKIGIGGATAAAKSGGNTGNGTCTPDVTTPVLVGAKVGVYQVRCSARAATAASVASAGVATAATGNTGNGTVTATPATGAGCQAGTYRAVCVVAASNGGTFDVFAPDGSEIGKAAVGTPFTTHLTFTIADGSADWIVGDAINITVAVGEYDETFRVTDPDGIVLGYLTVTGPSGSTTFSDAIKFAIADGSTDFIVGDGFDITVAAGSAKYLKSLSAAVDGSQAPDGVLAEDADATSGDAQAMVYFAGQFNAKALILGTAHTADSIREGLRAKGIHLVGSQEV